MLLQEEILVKVADTEGEENSYEDRLAVLSIAHHNLGVEFEFLKRYTEALAAYKKASEFAGKHLSPGHSITENLQNVYATAAKQMVGMQDKMEKRKRSKTSSGFTGYINAVARRTPSTANKKKRVSRGTNQFPTSSGHGPSSIPTAEDHGE